MSIAYILHGAPQKPYFCNCKRSKTHETKKVDNMFRNSVYHTAWTHFCEILPVFFRVHEFFLGLSPDILSVEEAVLCRTFWLLCGRFTTKNVRPILGWSLDTHAVANHFFARPLVEPFAQHLENLPDMSGMCGELRVVWFLVDCTCYDNLYS